MRTNHLDTQRNHSICFEENGAYPETYIGQGSNFGFNGGMLVDQTDDPRIKDAVKIAYLKKMWDNKSRLFTGTTTDVTKKMREVAV